MQKKIANLCRLILSDQNTRNLFFFLLLNLFFAFVELTYGLLTNRLVFGTSSADTKAMQTIDQNRLPLESPIIISLGLISDSFHMFFDCSALLLGLAASIVSKWKPSEKFTYGFGRAEILTGLANGLFLLFIALFIMKEAIERTFEPPEVHHERLFVISVLGFIVNLVGIFVFQHGGQGHHHVIGGCSHDHSHSSHKAHSHEHQNTHDYSHYSQPTIIQDNGKKSEVISLDMNGYSGQMSHHPVYTNHHDHHDHGHHQHDRVHASHEEPLIGHGFEKPRSSGRGQIMQSVFLHIVADTLGSVGVMISAVLMNQFGWMIADPLCSLFIAILISISVYPLLRDSIYVLMQRVPVELEDKLPDCLYKIQNLEGVLSVHETHFWTLNSDIYIGCLKLEVSQVANHRYIVSHAKNLLNQIGVDRVHIQIDPV